MLKRFFTDLRELNQTCPSISTGLDTNQPLSCQRFQSARERGSVHDNEFCQMLNGHWFALCNGRQQCKLCCMEAAGSQRLVEKLRYRAISSANIGTSTPSHSPALVLIHLSAPSQKRVGTRIIKEIFTLVKVRKIARKKKEIPYGFP